jgi:hypothetical protein
MFCLPTDDKRSLDWRLKTFFENLPKRKSLYSNTVVGTDGTRETIPLKMFCSPTEDERSLEAQNIFKNIEERDYLHNITVFEPNGTRETIPLKMMRGVWRPETSF